MARTDQIRSTNASGRTAGASSAPTITPVFPLLLLETMRDMDRPEEVLEDEDVTTSLPRRLGLSKVVFVQIRRFQEEVRQRRTQPASLVEDLVRLVVRRPDAERIFMETGRRVAHYFWMQRSPAMRRSVRLMPRPLASLAAHRATRRMFRQLVGHSRLQIGRWPMELRIHQSLTAEADPSGAACAFYAGAFGELLQYYTSRKYRVRHPQCETRGAGPCHWTVEVAS